MSWIGYSRNGWVSILPIVNVEGIRSAVTRHRDARRWMLEVRVVDEKEWMVWRIDRSGRWIGDDLEKHRDDPVVIEVLSRMNVLDRATSDVEKIRVVEHTVLGSMADVQVPTVTTVDQRDWTRSRPKGRRRRARQ